MVTLGTSEYPGLLSLGDYCAFLKTGPGDVNVWKPGGFLQLKTHQCL